MTLKKPSLREAFEKYVRERKLFFKSPYPTTYRAKTNLKISDIKIGDWIDISNAPNYQYLSTKTESDKVQVIAKSEYSIAFKAKKSEYKWNDYYYNLFKERNQEECQRAEFFYEIFEGTVAFLNKVNIFERGDFVDLTKIKNTNIKPGWCKTARIAEVFENYVHLQVMTEVENHHPSSFNLVLAKDELKDCKTNSLDEISYFESLKRIFSARSRLKIGNFINLTTLNNYNLFSTLHNFVSPYAKIISQDENKITAVSLHLNSEGEYYEIAHDILNHNITENVEKADEDSQSLEAFRTAIKHINIEAGDYVDVIDLLSIYDSPSAIAKVLHVERDVYTLQTYGSVDGKFELKTIKYNGNNPPFRIRKLKKSYLDSNGFKMFQNHYQALLKAEENLEINVGDYLNVSEFISIESSWVPVMEVSGVDKDRIVGRLVMPEIVGDPNTKYSSTELIININNLDKFYIKNIKLDLADSLVEKYKEVLGKLAKQDRIKSTLEKESEAAAKRIAARKILKIWKNFFVKEISKITPNKSVISLLDSPFGKLMIFNLFSYFIENNLNNEKLKILAEEIKNECNSEMILSGFDYLTKPPSKKIEFIEEEKVLVQLDNKEMGG